MTGANTINCAEKQSQMTKEQEAQAGEAVAGALPSYSTVALQPSMPGQDFSTVVFQQPYPVTATTAQSISPEKKLKDYLYLAIFSTICCFWPLGIFAIVKSRDVHKSLTQGDHKAAQKASRKAKYLSVAAIIVGILIFIIIAAAVGSYVGHHNEDGLTDTIEEGSGHPFNGFGDDD